MCRPVSACPVDSRCLACPLRRGGDHSSTALPHLCMICIWDVWRFVWFARQETGLLCTVCKEAVSKAIGEGCDAAGEEIASEVCGSDADLCKDAMQEACKICEEHCNVDLVATDACKLIHAC